jgi:hypothetical protein
MFRQRPSLQQSLTSWETSFVRYLSLSKVFTALGVKGTVIRLLLDQVAFANVVALVWNIYLSFASHTEVYTAPQTSPVVIEMAAPGDQKD